VAWLQLTISAAEQIAPQVGDLLTDLGAEAVTYRDAEDNPIFEPPIGQSVYWQQSLVTGLFSVDTDMQPIIQALSQSGWFNDGLQYKTDPLEDKDWERAWMDSFHPIQCGQQLWICPSWCPVPDPAAVNLLLDPGLAFGTGTHPTTFQCLQWLDGADLKGKTVVDFGCGSGILAIAALLLGAERAIGIDIDQQALIASKDNAERNGVADRLELYLPSQQPQLQADLVLANILAGPLQELAEVISAYVATGGDLIMSGILDRQIDQVTSAYQHQFSFSSPRVQEQWAMLHAQRKQ
jgi:ribosomal protein L11 methyltransferase